MRNEGGSESRAASAASTNVWSIALESAASSMRCTSGLPLRLSSTALPAVCSQWRAVEADARADCRAASMELGPNTNVRKPCSACRQGARNTAQNRTVLRGRTKVNIRSIMLFFGLGGKPRHALPVLGGLRLPWDFILRVKSGSGGTRADQGADQGVCPTNCAEWLHAIIR